jgi:hypothetical protein
MRKGSVVLIVTVLVAMFPSAPAFGWGAQGHRLITRRAIDLLPPEIQPFFATHRDEIVMRVNDPDLWRVVGWPDDPNHFLDFGVKEYGPYPFRNLPREYGAALEKFGRTTLERNGLLPWRVTELFGGLRRLFAEFNQRAPYTVGNTVLFAAITSHYLQDAYQPLHATDNFDGQLTNQRGLHQRFERDLIERFESRLTLTPAAPVGMANVRDSVFDILLASHQDVAPLLAADKAASARRTAYDEAYFEAFFAQARPLLERRLSGAITATASLIIGAWEQAGKPMLRVRDARPIERLSPAR